MTARRLREQSPREAAKHPDTERVDDSAAGCEYASEAADKLAALRGARAGKRASLALSFAFAWGPPMRVGAKRESVPTQRTAVCVKQNPSLEIRRRGDLTLLPARAGEQIV